MNAPRYALMLILVLGLAACEQQDANEKAAPSAVAGKGEGKGQGGGQGGERESNGAAEGDTDRGRFPDDGSRQWHGFERGKCGTRFYVVGLDGVRHDYARPAEFIDPMPTTEIHTAEGNVRHGVMLEALMEKTGAANVEFFSCRNNHQYVAKSEDIERHLLLLNGKGVLKLLMSMPEGEPRTPVAVVEHIELHGPEWTPTQPDTNAADESDGAGGAEDAD